MSELSKTKVGARLYCVVCRLHKKPIGRYAPTEMLHCSDGCNGYHQEPLPGSLWPGESEFDFGYKVGEQGVETK